MVNPTKKLSSTKEGPSPSSSTLGKGNLDPPQPSLVDSLEAIMVQVEADLELVLEAKSTLSPHCEIVAPITSLSRGQAKVSGSDEGEIIVKLNLTFMRVPPVFLGDSSVLFGDCGEVSLVLGGEASIHEAAVASSTSAIASPVLRGVTSKLPSVFPKFPHMEPLGADFSKGKDSIPFSPFSISPMGGDAPLPKFPTNQPFFGTPHSPPPLPDVPPSPPRSLGEMGGFIPYAKVIFQLVDRA